MITGYIVGVTASVALAALAPSFVEASGWVGNWSPGIGDPTFVGWFTVMAYAAATITCYLLRGRFSSHADTLRRKERRYWGSMTGILLFLCINKQLDLQSAMTEFFRICAKQQGWYDIRYKFQIAFIAAMAIALPVLAGILFLVARRLPTSTKIAGLGLIIIAVFVLIRAASFHHIDRLLGERLLHFKLNWIFELGGIAIVLVGARKRWKQVNSGPF